MQYRFLRLSEVKARTGLPKSTIYRRMSESTFPRQILIGTRTVVWNENDITEWQEKQMTANNNELRGKYEKAEER